MNNRLNQDDSVKNAFFGCVGAGACLVIVLAASSWLFQLVWNYLVPGLFHGPQLSYWQAAALLFFLTWIGNLFKSKSK